MQSNCILVVNAVVLAVVVVVVVVVVAIQKETQRARACKERKWMRKKNTHPQLKRARTHSISDFYSVSDFY